jgi:hypothetical protein
MRTLRGLALVLMFLTPNVPGYAGSATGTGRSADEANAWAAGRLVAKSKVPAGAKNVKYSSKDSSCIPSAGQYVCEVEATWDDPKGRPWCDDHPGKEIPNAGGARCPLHPGEGIE